METQMQHFPIFISTRDQRIVLSGSGDAAIAKLRLLLKTEAAITVYGQNPAPELLDWANTGRITLVQRDLEKGDVTGATLFYAADEDADKDAHNAKIAKSEGALINIVDNLQDSEFITPAIVDRAPVTVAIGTEGAAPVLARAIKADLEERLPPSLGLLAKIGKAFRPMADSLPMGRKRRDFWSDFYFARGPKALASDGQMGAENVLQELLDAHLSAKVDDGHVDFVGAGPGDPELLTLKARKALHAADVVIHDRLVPAAILELARREATILEAGKTGFGPSMSQEQINAMIVEHAGQGAHVVRLKSGDPTVFGRLDEELDAVNAAGIAWQIVPGITAASAGVAALGQSFTKRERNSSIRILTGHDIKGFADHDWAALARPGEVAAIYMGKRSARFTQGRLMMHGAAGDTPVTVIENISQPDQIMHQATLSSLPLAVSDVAGPAVIFLGLSQRAAATAGNELLKELAL